MNLDITYCSKIDCKDKKCERHQSNLADCLGKLYHPISIANFEKCERWEEK